MQGHEFIEAVQSKVDIILSKLSPNFAESNDAFVDFSTILRQVVFLVMITPLNTLTSKDARGWQTKS